MTLTVTINLKFKKYIYIYNIDVKAVIFNGSNPQINFVK